jgi:hypothetical protein
MENRMKTDLFATLKYWVWGFPSIHVWGLLQRCSVFLRVSGLALSFVLSTRPDSCLYCPRIASAQLEKLSLHAQKVAGAPFFTSIWLITLVKRIFGDDFRPGLCFSGPSFFMSCLFCPTKDDGVLQANNFSNVHLFFSYLWDFLVFKFLTVALCLKPVLLQSFRRIDGWVHSAETGTPIIAMNCLVFLGALASSFGWTECVYWCEI